MNTVKYEKPLIAHSADALSAVQAQSKEYSGYDNLNPEMQSIPAYQADE